MISTDGSQPTTSDQSNLAKSDTGNTSSGSGETVLVVPKLEHRKDTSENLKDNGWTEQSHTLLQLWLLRALLMLTRGNKSLRRLKVIHWLLTITYHVFCNVASGLSLYNVGSVVNDDTISVQFIIIAGLTSIIASIIAAIVQSLSLAEKIEKQKYSITKFSKLYRTLETCAFSPVEERESAQEFLSSVSEKWYTYHSASETVEESLNSVRKRMIHKKRTNDKKTPKKERQRDSHFIDIIDDAIQEEVSASDPETKKMFKNILSAVNFKNAVKKKQDKEIDFFQETDSLSLPEQ